MAYTKISDTILGETKETSIKHNIPQLKRQKEIFEKRLAEINKILAEAEKVGIQVSEKAE
jgi:hypothetical protein